MLLERKGFHSKSSQVLFCLIKISVCPLFFFLFFLMVVALVVLVFVCVCVCVCV